MALGIAELWRPLLNSLLCGGQLAVGAQLWCRALRCTLVAGPLVAGSISCGETQEEHLRNLILRKSDVDDNGASCDAASARVVHFASSSGSRIWTCRCSAKKLTISRELRKDTPSLIDVKGLGRPKFTGREEDFQQRPKKTGIFAGVINESEMMVERASEQPTEITTTAIDLEFLPTDTNEDGVQNLEFVMKQMHSWLSRVMVRMTLSGRILRRHGGDCRSDMILRQEEGNETFCARSFLLDGAHFWNSKR